MTAEECKREVEKQVVARERELREGLRAERDREIELVIARLETESTSSRAELERAAEARLK